MKNFNWIFKSRYTLIVLWAIISFEITIIIFVNLHFYNILNKEPSFLLNMIIPVNSIIISLLVVIFLNLISIQNKRKELIINKAVLISEKITNFRLILNTLTEKFCVWQNDNATKKLFDTGIFKNIDYFEYKLMSMSQYSPVNKDLLKKLFQDSNHLNSQSDLYLSMISLVRNRKKNIVYDYINDPYFITNKIYNLEFVSKCIAINHIDSIWFWFNENCNFINYSNLNSDDIKNIKKSIKIIDSKRKVENLNDKVMAEICQIMSTNFKDLFGFLRFLDRGISSNNLFLLVFLCLCLVFGILFPFLITILNINLYFKTLLVNILISLNFGYFIFLIATIFPILRKENFKTNYVG